MTKFWQGKNFKSKKDLQKVSFKQLLVVLFKLHPKGNDRTTQKILPYTILYFMPFLHNFIKAMFFACYLKGAGSRNCKQTCYLYNLYHCPHVAIVLCTDFGGWGESTGKLLPKIHQYLCNRTAYECFVCFSTELKSPSSN